MTTEPLSKIRIGLIGAGGIAHAHAKALGELGRLADLRAVCEVDAARGRAFQQNYHIAAVYQDPRDLLADKTIEVVGICTPAFNHAELTCAALRAGKWALCEKPLGGSLRELDAILAVERETGRRAASVCQQRLGKGLRAVAELVQAGKAGRPLVALSETFWRREQKTYYDTAPWRGTWAGEMGGCLMTQAIHGLDSLLSIFGDPAWVCTDAAALGHSIKVDDCAAATVHFKSGALAGIVATTCCCHEDISRLRLVFERLTACSAEKPGTFGDLPWSLTAREPALQTDIDACLERWRTSPERDGHAGQWGAFLDAFRRQSEPLVSTADARRTLELVAGLYRSAIRGEKTVFPIEPGDPFYASMNGGQALRGAP